MTRVAVNGIELNVERRGTGPALLLLHGFTGSAESWSKFHDAWRDFTTVAVDIIGHGRSDAPADPSRYSTDHCIEDLVALLDALDIERTALLGYSMGGRVALRFALRHPERLYALVLESASPGIEDAEERASRIRSDEALAQRLERDGLESFIDYWESIPLWASQASLPEEKRAALRRQRLENSVLGLANSLRGMGAGMDEPVLDQLGRVAVPALLIAGALDEKYAALATAMAPAMPRAELRIVEGAGHAVHFERPEVFADLVKDFVGKQAPAGAREVRT